MPARGARASQLVRPGRLVCPLPVLRRIPAALTQLSFFAHRHMCPQPMTLWLGSASMWLRCNGAYSLL